MRILPQELWDAAKVRQDELTTLYNGSFAGRGEILRSHERFRFSGHVWATPLTRGWSFLPLPEPL
ncbi:hypothetical protein CHELA20_53835 [Hyphomicrobiales bacterium]|nr:hypothetical protein CHELA41_21092 [Hyphomicrobiales bacterium]CAH1685044.1 hypothetical protein CHELA20_53835 [Hyphomicrobiales bacterium]